MGRSAWVRFIYLLAVSLILSCGVLSVLLINKATEPYYEMMKTPQKVREGKLDYYLTGETHSQIFELIHAALTEISREQFQMAEEHIIEAAALDPQNALFEYILAALCFKSNDYTHMWRHIRAGNDMGTVRLYASQYVGVEGWTHPEISAIRHMVTVMSRGISTQDELWELVRLGNAIAWCEPADIDTVATGLTMRDIATTRMMELAVIDKDQTLVDLCKKVLSEKQKAYDNYKESIASSSLRRVSIPTMLMAMAHYRRNPYMRESLLIYATERQAEEVIKLRKKTLKVPIKKTIREQLAS